jgi:hypothetical protein
VTVGQEIQMGGVGGRITEAEHRAASAAQHVHHLDGATVELRVVRPAAEHLDPVAESNRCTIDVWPRLTFQDHTHLPLMRWETADPGGSSPWTDHHLHPILEVVMGKHKPHFPE